MDFRVTCDAEIESGLNSLLNDMDDDGFEAYFIDKFYEDSGIAMFIVLMCRNPLWDFKQRIRFVKKENCLYMDVMLDLVNMQVADPTSRKRIVGEKIVNEVPQIIAKKKFKDFDLPRFASDLRAWFEVHNWIDKKPDE